MTEQSISVRRDGSKVLIEDRQTDADYAGVLKQTRMSAKDAFEFAQAIAAIAREILALPHGPKTLSLASAYSLYPEDATEAKP